MTTWWYSFIPQKFPSNVCTFCQPLLKDKIFQLMEIALTGNAGRLLKASKAILFTSLNKTRGKKDLKQIAYYLSGSCYMVDLESTCSISAEVPEIT